MNIETANRLYQYRKRNHLSQEELAEKIGVSRQAVSKWERAEASPDTDNLIMLSKIYKVSLDDLLNENDVDQSNEQSENETENATGKGIHFNSDDGHKVDVEFENDGIHIKHTSDDSKNNCNDFGGDDCDDCNGCNSGCDGKEGKDHISFKNGIHIHSKDGDKVDIGLGGIHVDDHDGDKVHVGWNGVHVDSVDDDTHVHVDKNGVFVNESGKQTVYTDENGNVVVDDKYKKKSKLRKFFNQFHYPIIVAIAYLGFGFFNTCGGWGFGWLIFLTIPLYYTLVSAIFDRNPSHFAYPVLVTAVYLWLGLFMALWHPMWILFLTIPIYYFICDIIKKAGKNQY